MNHGKKIAVIFFQLFLLILLIWPTHSKSDHGLKQTSQTMLPSFQEGEILVKFRKSMLPGEIQSLVPGLQGCRAIEFSTLSRQTQKAYYLIQSSSLTLDQLMNLFANSAEVEALSPNYRRELVAIPNDLYWGKQWGMQKISAPQAWDLTVGSPSVVVGVIDSGIDYNHEDILSNIWANPAEIRGNGIDDDHNGYVDDYFGYDFASDNQGNNGPDPMDSFSHGTHVAGTIAAAGNNALGVAGVSWNTKIMALKIVRPNDSLNDSDAIEAIEYAIKMKQEFHVNIVALNASWGGMAYNPLLKDAVDEAGKADIIFVAAAGNGGDDDVGDDLDQSPFYPASFTSANILAVAATTPDDQLADFSNYGVTSVDLAAPGTSIYSTIPLGTLSESQVVFNSHSLEALPLEYAGKTPANGITGILIDCKKGLTAEDFPPTVAQNIALIERGDTKFREKVLLAQNAMATAAVIYNNQSGNFSGTLCDSGDVNCQKFPWIPAVAISQEDGHLLKSSLPLSITLHDTWPLYTFMEGTSMATPHVAGVVALLAAYYPQENYSQRMSRILAGCDSVSSLEGKVSSGGRLNALQAMKMSILVALYATRKTAVGWLIEQDVGLIRLSVDPERIEQISGYRFVVQRKEQNAAFSIIREVASSEISNGVYEFYDKYLDKEKKYIYLIQVFNATDALVGKSNQQTI